MKTIISVAALAVAVVGVYLVNDLTRSVDGKSVLHVAGEPAIKVATAPATAQDIVRTVQAPGDVEPLSEVDISGEVMAKILEMPVEEGDRVDKGDLLCRLDDADYQARLTSAEANVAKLKAVIQQAVADREKAVRDYQRQVRLAESDATSSTELADYRTAMIKAEAAIEIRRQELVEAEARLASAREDLEKTVIAAPIGGVVAQRFAKEGEVVVTGTMNNPGTRIMVISDLSAMQVRCRVDEGDAPLVKPGQPARIYLQSDTQNFVPGHVLRVATKGTKPAGRDVVTFETLVLVDSDDPRVKPGMSANVEIEVARREDALTVPVEAVVHRKRRDLPETLVAEHDERERQRAGDDAVRRAEYLKVVFCVRDGVAEPRLVETGISDEINVELISGVTDAEPVVIGPFRSLDRLKAGSPVELEESESADDTTPTNEAHARDDAGDEGASADPQPRDQVAGADR